MRSAAAWRRSKTALPRRVGCSPLHETAVGPAWLSILHRLRRALSTESAHLQGTNRFAVVAEANGARRDGPCDRAAPVLRCWLRAERALVVFRSLPCIALAPAGRARAVSDRVRRSANPSSASRERRNRSSLTCPRYSCGENIDSRRTDVYFYLPMLTAGSLDAHRRRSRRCRRRRHRSSRRPRACRRVVRRPCRAGCPAGSGCGSSAATRASIRDRRRAVGRRGGPRERAPPFRPRSSAARPRGAAHAPGAIHPHRAGVARTRSTLATPICHG